MEPLKFKKVRDVKDPITDFSENAGIDIFVPEYSSDFEKDLINKNSTKYTADGNSECSYTEFFTIEDSGDFKYIKLKPQCDVLIPSGLKACIPTNKMCLKVDNKSGIATKSKLVCGATIIDYSYEGECHIHLINTSNYPQMIKFGQKIVQLIPVPIETPEVVISTGDIFEGRSSKRGEGGFGSTSI